MPFAPIFSASALSTWTCTGADRLHAAGNSITVGGISGPGGTSVAFWQGLAALVGSPTFTHDGASGTTMAQFAGSYPTMVTAFNPTVVLIEWGTNDVLTSVAPATTAANLRTGVLGCLAIIPGLRFVILPVVALGEQWPAGANSNDAAIAATNRAMRDMCDTLASAGVTITWAGSVRDNWMVAEAAANPTDDGAGFYLTADHVHPLANGAAVWTNALVSIHV